MSDYDHTLRCIASELRKIRDALERMSPPPPKKPRESAYARRGVTVI